MCTGPEQRSSYGEFWFFFFLAYELSAYFEIAKEEEKKTERTNFRETIFEIIEVWHLWSNECLHNSKLAAVVVFK